MNVFGHLSSVGESRLDWIPLAQSLVWPVFIGLVLLCWRKRMSNLFEAFTQAIATGRIKKIGPVEWVAPEDVPPDLEITEKQVPPDDEGQ
jgi:hypothetical protein